MAITDRVKRLLWARSGGFCQNPSCLAELFLLFEDGSLSSVEELAHIISQSVEGPRGDGSLSRSQRDEYENVILLCPTCHSLVDKNPEKYPVELLVEWKRNHEQRIRTVFVVPVFNERSTLAREVHRLLRENHLVFEAYGPRSSHSVDPLTDAVKMWLNKVQTVVIPNNRRLAQLITANTYLLTDGEKQILDRFVIHQEAFEYNHVSGDKLKSATTFPDAMNEILSGE